MKSAIALAAVLLTQTYMTQVHADPIVRDVAISIHDVFVPEKVEHGADAKIILSGMFPNTCYRWDHAKVKHLTSMSHVVQAHAMLTQTMCLMVLVPFSKEVNMGPLQAGSHTLRFLNGDDTYFERTLIAE